MKIIKMRFSIEPTDRIYVKGYGFLSFVKNMSKTLSNKYGQKPLNIAKKSTTDGIKTASKRAIQKIAEATSDLIGNRMADKITNLSKKFSRDLHSKNDEIEISIYIYIYISQKETTNY